MTPLAWIVVAATLALLAASSYAALVRVRQGVAIALLAAAALLPVLGLAGTVVGMAESFHTIETLKAPTPKDLASGVHESIVCGAIGFAGMVLCGAVGIVAVKRSKRGGPTPSSK